MKKNIIANFIGKFWSILSGFLFLPLYIHYLGFESYSIISFTLVITGLMGILDAGLTATLSREFARNDKSNNEKIQILETLESAYFLIGGLCIIIVFASSWFIANEWLNLNSYNPDKVSLFLKIISFDIGFQLLSRFYTGGLIGLDKQVDANIFQISYGIIRNGLIIVPIIFIPKLEIFFLWQAFSTIIYTLSLKGYLDKKLTGIFRFFSKPHIKKNIFKNIWRFAGGMMLISLVGALNSQMDKIAISKLLTIESLGYYTLALSLGNGIITLVSPFSIALLPRFTSLYSEEKTFEATELYNKINLFVSILVFSVMASMIFFSKDIIWAWTGNSVLAKNSYRFVPLIAFSYAMISLQMIPFNIAIANGYTKLNNLLGIFSLFITMPGYWIAIKFFGSIGAAAVFCFIQTIATFIYLYFISSKFLKAKSIIKDIFFKELLLPLFISLIVVFCLSFFSKDWMFGSRIITLLIIGSVTLISFSITLLILIPIADIKKIFRFTAIVQNKSI